MLGTRTIMVFFPNNNIVIKLTCIFTLSNCKFIYIKNFLNINISLNLLYFNLYILFYFCEILFYFIKNQCYSIFILSKTYILKEKYERKNIYACYYQEKGLVWWGSEISSAGKEATLNTLIIVARLQTQPSWTCVGAVMDTSDHYTNVFFNVQYSQHLVKNIKNFSKITMFF